MKQRDVQRILKETAYVRMGGSAEELRCANYIKDECAKLGADAQIESFEVDMADILECELTADGIKIPCKGYFNAGSACIEAPFYYLRDNSDYSLSQCKDHIVMIDGYMGYWKYQDLIENGAVGFITYDGNTNYADRDIDQRELRSFVSKKQLAIKSAQSVPVYGACRKKPWKIFLTRNLKKCLLWKI